MPPRNRKKKHEECEESESDFDDDHVDEDEDDESFDEAGEEEDAEVEDDLDDEEDVEAVITNAAEPEDAEDFDEPGSRKRKQRVDEPVKRRKADAEDRAAQKVPKNKAAGKGRKAEPAEPVDPALPSEPDEAALALESRQLLANASGGGDTEGGDAEGVDDEGEGDKKINNNNDKKKKRSVISNDLKAKMRGEDPRAKVLLCMYKRNRPGNAATVEGFTGHKIPKGIVQNILEDLSKTGELCAKEGKNKVYWFNQELFRSKCLNLTKLNKDVEDRGEALSTCQEERACVEKKLKELEATPAEVDLGRIVEELASRRDEIRDRAASLRTISVDITPAEREKQQKMFLSFRESWVKRKRQCSEVIGHLADSMDKKPKATEEMIGIETDGDVGVQVPALPAATRKKTPVIRKLKKK